MKGRRRGPGPRHPRFNAGRRRFLAGAAGAAGSLILPGCSGDPGNGVLTGPVGQDAQPLPADPSTSGIDHIVVLMMENRSFDHFLGWLPGADGKQAGLTYFRGTDAFETWDLGEAGEFQGCAYQDPDHSHEGAIKQLNSGNCDGWLRTSANDQFPIGYYTDKHLPFFAGAAPAWTVYDRYFCSTLAETYPNRFYMHSAQTYQIHNNIQDAFTNPAKIPTIWDLLKAAGVTGNYYYSDAPFVGLWGNKYVSDGTAQPFSAFLTAAAAGTLPSVSYVDPSFEDEGSGTSKDDHPHADIRDGEVFINQVYNAVVTSPHWVTDKNIALFITYDEWGGFFDHVLPPDPGVIPDADRAACEREGVEPYSSMGFRVPTLAISPRARRNYISSTPYDHCSILKMIEWRFGLSNLTVRDQIANNIAFSFDWTNPPDATAPTFTVPSPSGASFGTACQAPAGTAAAASQARHAAEMRQLRLLAKHYGFPVRGD